MKRMSWLVVGVSGLVIVVAVLCQNSLGLAQSWWPFGSNQGQEKMQGQGQAPVERAFSENNYKKLNEKERALAREKYDEFLKKNATANNDKNVSPDIEQIKPLELPENPFQSPDFKAFEGSKQ